MTHEKALLELCKNTLCLDPVLSVSTLGVFFFIANNPDCTAAEIGKYLNLAQPAVTRHVQRLGAGSSSVSVGRGLGLVESYDDPAETRRKLYNLSEIGNNLLKEMLSEFGSGCE